MNEMVQKERLQPCLLDRLTDNEPGKSKESREKRFFSTSRQREAVLRDLSWLLNSHALARGDEFKELPLIASSVLNYGIMDLTGATLNSLNIRNIEERIRQAIRDFEPRIDRNTVRVRSQVDSSSMNQNALVFHIEGKMWADPVPLHLYIKTELDLETGTVSLTEQSSGSNS